MRFGLRLRVIALFATGALALSFALAVATFGVTRSNLLAEREAAAIRSAAVNGKVVQDSIAPNDNGNVLEVLQGLNNGARQSVLLRRDQEQPFSPNDNRNTAAITAQMTAMVQDRRESAVQRVGVDGEPFLVVGVPLNAGDAYFEIGALGDLQDTLDSLARTLFLVGAITTIAGALLGLWAGRVLLRPLAEVASAAQRISQGDMTVRLEPSPDPDLVPITQSFNTMVDEVALRMERDRRFAADVSHELRSPLQVLTAASSVLMNRVDDMDPRSQAAASLVALEAARFTDLVQDLLELARDELPLNLQQLDVAAQLTDLAAGRVQDLDLSRAPERWSLDRRRFERVVTNLLDNAVHHGGGPTRLGAFEQDGQLVVEIDDEGPGVPQEERSLIFDRFGRGRAASARGHSDGTGLGLSLVAQHTTAHGGTVTVLDRPGGGARFRVEIP